MKEIWDKLYDIAKRQLQNHPELEQIIVVRTDAPMVYSFENRVLTRGTEDEDRFIRELIVNNDTTVEYIVCMWNNGGIDLPSYHFRERLLKMSERNAKAKILLQGENFVEKTIRAVMPE